MIYAVGYNEEGEIGLGHRSNLCDFTRLSFCDSMHITGVYYGSQSFFYLTANLDLYCCGYNKYGQLGLGHSTEYITKPTLNKHVRERVEFISNSVCAYHTILKTVKGRMYGYGWNSNGQLGIGRKSFKESVPQPLLLGMDVNIISISCGFHHTLFLTDDGRVVCCGNNQYGQLGFGCNVDEVVSPTMVEWDGFEDMLSVQCGEYFSVSLDKAGNVWSFGRNDSGQLGLPQKRDCVFTPKLVPYFKRKELVVAKVECGDFHVLCLDAKGSVYSWGNNEYGQTRLSAWNMPKTPISRKSSPDMIALCWSQTRDENVQCAFDCVI